MSFAVAQITLDEAKAYVGDFHAHSDPTLSHKWSLAAIAEHRIVGVAVIGRPSSRVIQTDDPSSRWQRDRGRFYARKEHVVSGACVKRRYPTLLTAYSALDRLDTKQRKPGEKKETRAYRCPVCKGWHLTASVHRKDMKHG